MIPDKVVIAEKLALLVVMSCLYACLSVAT